MDGMGSGTIDISEVTKSKRKGRRQHRSLRKFLYSKHGKLICVNVVDLSVQKLLNSMILD